MENMAINYAVGTTETESLTIYNESRDMARMTNNSNTSKLPKKCLQKFLNLLDTHIYLKTDNVDGVEKAYISPNVFLISEYVEFAKLVEDFKSRATVEKYDAGKTENFISLFSVKEAWLKAKEYYSFSIVAVSTEGQTDWNLLQDFRKLYEMDDGVTRPTRSGITLSDKLPREVISNIKNLKEAVNNFPKSLKRKLQEDESPIVKKQCIDEAMPETYKECRECLKTITSMVKELNR